MNTENRFRASSSGKNLPAPEFMSAMRENVAKWGALSLPAEPAHIIAIEVGHGDRSLQRRFKRDRELESLTGKASAVDLERHGVGKGQQVLVMYLRIDGGGILSVLFRPAAGYEHGSLDQTRSVMAGLNEADRSGMRYADGAKAYCRAILDAAIGARSIYFDASE